MRLSLRIMMATVVLGLVLAGASYSHPSWSEQLGLDFWSVPSLRDTIARHQRQHAQLDAEDQVVLERIAVKQSIIGELVAGRVGLTEAAARFRALNAARPVYQSVIRHTYGGESEAECYCRNVLDFVAADLRDDARRGDVLRRLTGELERLRAAGRITLPDVPDDAEELTDAVR